MNLNRSLVTGRSAATVGRRMQHACVASATAPNSVLESVPNFRDIAWVRTELKSGRVMRCAKPSDASEADVTRLLDELGVRVLLDLRSGEELREDTPNSKLFSRAVLQSYRRGWSGRSAPAPSQTQPLASSSGSSGSLSSTDTDGVVWHHVSLMEKWRFYGGLLQHLPLRTTAKAALLRPLSKERSREALLKDVNEGGLSLMYKSILDSARPEICAALHVVLSSLEQRKPVLLFCKAGKDRTGLISALVLTAAGCCEEDVIRDYVRSDAYRKVALAGIEKDPRVRGLDLKVFEGSPAEAMKDAFAHMRQRYNSPEAYMTWIGFGPEHRQRLRSLLTDSDWQPVSVKSVDATH